MTREFSPAERRHVWGLISVECLKLGAWPPWRISRYWLEHAAEAWRFSQADDPPVDWPNGNPAMRELGEGEEPPAPAPRRRGAWSWTWQGALPDEGRARSVTVRRAGYYRVTATSNQRTWWVSAPRLRSLLRGLSRALRGIDAPPDPLRSSPPCEPHSVAGPIVRNRRGDVDVERSSVAAVIAAEAADPTPEEVARWEGR